jgi:hypothetical protein
MTNGTKFIVGEKRLLLHFMYNYYNLTQTILCDELITCPEESYRVWCVVVCNLENS